MAGLAAIDNFRIHLTNFSDPTATDSPLFRPGLNFTVAPGIEKGII